MMAPSNLSMYLDAKSSVSVRDVPARVKSHPSWRHLLCLVASLGVCIWLLSNALSVLRGELNYGGHDGSTGFRRFSPSWFSDPEARPYNQAHRFVKRDDSLASKWEAEAEAKYANLSDDKFTLIVQTYKRPELLVATLNLTLSERVPELDKIIVVWNDVDLEPPGNFTFNNVTVEFRQSAKNSLNEKFRPDPSIKTKAVLLSDDDVYYHPSDLGFVFEKWREQKYRLTGAFSRCVEKQEDGTFKYSCVNDATEKDGTSPPTQLILTGLTFAHVDFLDQYMNKDDSDLNMTSVREYVDDKFNCEDIAMNFMVSKLTGTGPMQVIGNQKPVNRQPPDGLSTKPGHLEERTECINKFIEFFGGMPLKETTGYISRGRVPG